MSAPVRVTQVSAIASFDPTAPGVVVGTLVVDTSTDSVWVVRLSALGVRSLVRVQNLNDFVRGLGLVATPGAPASGEVTFTGTVTNVAGVPVGGDSLFFTLSTTGAALAAAGVVGDWVIVDGGASICGRVVPNAAGVFSVLATGVAGDTLTLTVDGLNGVIADDQLAQVAP